MARWKMNKLGFLNFWLYDQEEFPLHNGHILLRGSNAAGKSITTQSFIPFILDGDRRPERLDPFGSRDRKMEYYLLGDDQREESTGYLYLEFRKGDTAEYRTIGVGMRAQRGKGIDFWGFCLRDGRRIGPEGLLLYESVGKQNLPLSKQKLRSLINDPDCWAESQSRYKELVNAQIFGFRDIRQYDQLVQLLILVRAPKLSKDFRPTEVKKLLNQSLQVLTDDDLSAMVSTMEQMDSLEETLSSYRAAILDARSIHREYTRYNQFILGRKSSAYLEARNRSNVLRQHLQDEEARGADLAQQLTEAEASRTLSAQRLAQANAQRLAMGEDDLSAKQAQLRSIQEECAQLETQLAQGTQALQDTEDAIRRRETELRQLTADAEDDRAGLRQALRELSRENALLALGDAHQQYVRGLQAERPVEDAKPLFAALRQREEQISATLRCLQQAEAARTVYDNACLALDQAEAEVNATAAALRDAQAQEQEARDLLLEAFTRRQEANVRLNIPQTIWLDIRRALTAYSGPADWSPIRDCMDQCARQAESALRTDQLRAESALSRLQQERDTLNRLLQQVKRQPEPIPPRREQTAATRLQLAMQNIPCAPLYQLLDFAPDLPQADRDLLEAQLLDAGLLDALVVPEEHLSAVQALLSEFPDCFLLPGPAVDDPITALIPDPAGRFPQAAAACLRSISRIDLTAETALLPDGRFRSGMLRGHSRARETAGFVGAAAREANRQRQIQDLEAQLEHLEDQVQAAQEEAARCGLHLEQLAEERAQMPTAEALDHALDQVRCAQQSLAQAEEKRTGCRSEAQSAKRSWAALEQACITSSAGLPYARTADAYEEAQAAAAVYREILGELSHLRQRLDYTLRTIGNQQEMIDEQLDQAADKRTANSQLQQMISARKAGAAELQAYLDRPENLARSRRLAELDQEIQLQDRENRESDRRCTLLAEQIRSSGETLQRRKQALTDAVICEQDLENYLREELDLGLLPLAPDRGLADLAQDAVSAIPAADRERTPESMGNMLSGNYQKLRSNLSSYHPEIRLVFDAPSQAGQLRQRYVILLKKNGQELPLSAFIQSLQTDIDTTGALLEDRDRELFENILVETISQTLRARITESAQWTQSMSALMSGLTTSMGLHFSLDWREKKAEGSGELDTAQLVTLLNKDRALLTPEDSQRVSGHFRSRVKRAREEARIQGLTPNYADLIRGVLDYRSWYEFRLFFQREDGIKRELTDRAFNRFSGGEKAMAMYVPLFASVSAQYLKGGDACPRLLALDEAFAGVDDQNISAMFVLMGQLDFDYIINSQILWGCYACVEDLDIAEMHHPAGAPVVTILHYHWNGTQRTLEGGEQ